MRLVVDANILFALTKSSSTASWLANKYTLKLLSPDFALIELYKYKDELVHKSGLKEFDEVVSSLNNKVVFIDKEEYRHLIKKALSLLPDPKDAAYLALSLRFFLPIWSNDTHLKQQSKREVFTTKDLVNSLDKLVGTEK